MRIGVRTEPDEKLVQFYSTYYDILRTPDFDESSRLLKPKHGLHQLGMPGRRICRFCGKQEGEVEFKKIAHAFPECIGNKALKTNYECDTCNDFFGKTIENDYANYFNLFHSIMQISGKNGEIKCGFKVPCAKRTDECMRYCINILYKDNQLQIHQCKEVSEQYISFIGDSVTISKPIGNCCPIAVFKAIVKTAITVMPIEEIIMFDKTIQWLLNPEHSNIYNSKKLLVRYQMIPGFNVTKYPHYFLYRRKRDVWNVPYMLFNLTYGCFSLLIEVPRDNEINTKFEKIPFPPIPFYTSTEDVWDLSDNLITKNQMHSIVLNYESTIDCTDEYSNQ